MIWFSAAAFAVAWWLGMYLVARDPRKAVLRRAGAGLIGYAVALMAVQVWPGAGGVRWATVCLPALAWSGVFVRLLPEPRADRIDRWWQLGLAPVVATAAAGAAAGVERLGHLAGALALLALAATLSAVLGDRGALRHPRLRGTPGLLAVGSMMLGLSVVAVLLGFDLLPRALLLPGIAMDLVLLGVGVATFDAFDEGEALGADMARSLLGAGAAALVFGGQVAVALAVVGRRPALELVLYGTLAAAITAQVWSGPIQILLDRAVFRSGPLRRTRTDLRGAAEALPRMRPQTDWTEAEFARLTRRALSHYADLGRLVSSPLVDLPVIGDRLERRSVPDGPLERAAELKLLLTEAIARLKPRTDDEFGTSEEWRHYNALYFYYVRGIRPYSVRTKRTDLDPASRRALSWFVDHVPQRTLHNWQNAAARLVAADLSAVPATPVS